MPKKSGKYFLLDDNDRMFTMENDGIFLELKANVKTEVPKDVAKTLKEKYPYLQLIIE